MHTILGATGQIAIELARELHRSHPGELRLVSRAPRPVNGNEELVPADLLAPEFYGPGRTQSVTNALVIDPCRARKRPRVPVRDDTRRTPVTYRQGLEAIFSG